jgi:maltooligosyltrehalose trehalohydrolase
VQGLDRNVCCSGHLVQRHPIGAEVNEGGVSFRVWAPACRQVAVSINGRQTAMQADQGGYFSAIFTDARAGDRYGFTLDGSDTVTPDPASRFQPDGPHAPSAIVDPSTYVWKHPDWRVEPLAKHVIYELHVGTFSREGTWAGAADRLGALRDLGITLIEVMPVGEFPGAFGWGYDGVQWFAPYHGYGSPDDFRAFVDTAHGLGLAVILDVVYNHFGPDGNYLSRFTQSAVSRQHSTEWGDAINFDGDGSQGMRDLAVANARYWIEEFRLDGLRLDAVQQIFDRWDTHIVKDIVAAARDAAGARRIIVVAEHEPQHARLVRSRENGGAGLDGLWNDDFHHAAMVALTGDRSAYYHDYDGTARELVSCARHGFLFQGQRYAWQKAPRGAPALDVAPAHFIAYLENHDQVANSSRSLRLHQRAAPAALRAMTALLLLGPWTPMLFQGQEFASTKPFLFFADHAAELAAKVSEGRAAFLRQFPATADPAVAALLPPPHKRETAKACVLDDAERDRNVEAMALHRDLIALRRTDATLTAPDVTVDGSPLDTDRLLLRFHAAGVPERLLVVNLGTSFDAACVSDPLVAPPSADGWRVAWHSERPAYGGGGMAPLEPGRWLIPARSAVLLGGNA